MTTLLIIVLIYLSTLTIFQLYLTIYSKNVGNKLETTDKFLKDDVDVIIPAYNEEKTIIKSIKSCMNQTIRSTKTIIIDDGSTDNTAKQVVESFGLKELDSLDGLVECSENEEDDFEIISAFESEDKSILLVIKTNGGKYDALNLGMKVSKSKWVLNIDADSILKNTTIETLLKHLTEETKAITAVIGMSNGCEVDEQGRIQKNTLPYNPLVISQFIEYMRTSFMLKLSLLKSGGVSCLSGACSMLDREYTISVGGYKDKLTEDSELTLRMKKNGGFIGFVPQVLSYTQCPDNVSQLNIQRNRWLRGMFRDIWEYRGMVREKNSLGRVIVPYFFLSNFVFPWVEIIGWGVFTLLIFFTGFTIIGFQGLMILLAIIFGLHFLNNLVLLYIIKDFINLKGYGKIWYVTFISLVDIIYYRPIMLVFLVKSQIKELFAVSFSWGVLKRKEF